MLSTIKNSRRLGWLSLGIGAIEIFATRKLQTEMGIDRGGHIIRAFGVREIVAGVVLLAQPGLNRSLVAGLWARLGGDIVDLLALSDAARYTRRPGPLAAITALVMGVTGIDALFALRSQWELNRAAQIAKAARKRVRPTAAIPSRKGSPRLERVATAVNA